MEKMKLELIIESEKGLLNGRVTYNDNLLVDSGKSISELEEKIKMLLHDFEELRPEEVEFEHSYDVYALFEQFDFLKISKVAEYAGINASLLRQYASQVKFPSLAQAKKIERTIHHLAKQMMEASLHVDA